MEATRLINLGGFSQGMHTAVGRPAVAVSWHMGWLVPGVQKGGSHPNKSLSSALYDPKIMASGVCRWSLISVLVKSV